MCPLIYNYSSFRCILRCCFWSIPKRFSWNFRHSALHVISDKHYEIFQGPCSYSKVLPLKYSNVLRVHASSVPLIFQPCFLPAVPKLSHYVAPFIVFCCILWESCKLHLCHSSETGGGKLFPLSLSKVLPLPPPLPPLPSPSPITKLQNRYSSY